MIRRSVWRIDGYSLRNKRGIHQVPLWKISAYQTGQPTKLKIHSTHTFREVFKEGVVIYQIGKTKRNMCLLKCPIPRIQSPFTFRLVGLQHGFTFLLLWEAAEAGSATQGRSEGFLLYCLQLGQRVHLILWKNWAAVSGCILQFRLTVKLAC